MLYARNSSFSIRSNTFTNNSAIDYGVTDAPFDIIISTFAITVLLMVVLWSHINLCLISSAVPSLATMLMLRMELWRHYFSSIFNIRDSVFSDNRAKQNCGVIYAGNSSFSIGSNTFADNSAIHHGVMTIVNSAFDIISSTFTNNGGVMATFADSLFDIIGSTFTNNAGVLDGVTSWTHIALFSVLQTASSVITELNKFNVWSQHNSCRELLLQYQ